MKRTILYFDDDASCLEVFESIFRDEYDVLTATELADARRKLQKCPFEIVISDQRMPEISGTEFLAEVAQICPKSFRVMVTGSMTVGEAIPEISSGIVHLFVSKPWEEQSMREMLERASRHFDLRQIED